MTKEQAEQLASDICEYYGMDENNVFKSSYPWDFYYSINGKSKHGFVHIAISKYEGLESEIYIAHTTKDKKLAREVIETFAQGEYSLELAKNKGE